MHHTVGAHLERNDQRSEGGRPVVGYDFRQGVFVASKKAKKKTTVKTQPAPRGAWKKVARADVVDFRDRLFLPSVGKSPAEELFPKLRADIKNQGETSACTGFSLSVVVEHLMRAAGRKPSIVVSPFMLYSMARRYDEFPGSVKDDGSSLRGGLKGWFKHGACSTAHFPELDMPAPAKRVQDDWWFDAVKRPLGAYYRVNPESITDMQAALNEVGILYASVGCHSGWDEGNDMNRRTLPKRIADVWRIPFVRERDPGVHAIVMIGYDRRGFLIQNSWGKEWGSHGYAILGYDDWRRCAVDCWVAQLGVVTDLHLALSKEGSLEVPAGAEQAMLAKDKVLRNRQLAPYVLNMENDGRLSQSGDFRTNPSDVVALTSTQVVRARQDFGLRPTDPIDICLYAHGGLVSEDTAAATASHWIGRLYAARILPIFLMWETGPVSTLRNILEDAWRDLTRAAGFSVEAWLNQRIERATARAGTAFWTQMKQNAEAMSQRLSKPDDQQPGLVQLADHLPQAGPTRLHFVGHSAGSIVAAHLLNQVPKRGRKPLTFESLTLLAPAVRLDVFEDKVKPRLADGTVRRYRQVSLTRKAEEEDNCLGIYRQSLLYLVSHAFEGGARTEILGLERDAPAAKVKSWKNSELYLAPNGISKATSHGDFGEDKTTIESTIAFMRK